MATAALFDLLTDFGASRPRTGGPAPVEYPPTREQTPSVDVDALVARAVADAETALEATLTQAHQTALEAEREKNAAETKAFLESFGDDAGKMIAERIDAAEARVSEVIGASVARILGRILGDDLSQRSLDALAVSIRASIGDREAVRISVRGPQSLFETLTVALGPHADHLDFVEASGFDLTVAIDDTVIETRMGEWAETLNEILP
jgi:hypothetical protein